MSKLTAEEIARIIVQSGGSVSGAFDHPYSSVYADAAKKYAYQLARAVLDKPAVPEVDAPAGELGEVVKLATQIPKQIDNYGVAPEPLEKFCKLFARNLLALHAENAKLKAELVALKNKFHHKNCKDCINCEEIEKWSTGKIPKCCWPCHRGELAGIIFHPGWRPLPEPPEPADEKWGCLECGHKEAKSKSGLHVRFNPDRTMDVYGGFILGLTAYFCEKCNHKFDEPRKWKPPTAATREREDDE